MWSILGARTIWPMAKARRALIATIAVLGVVALAPTAAAAKTPKPLANPPSNTAPGHAFVHACVHMGTSKAANEKCDAAALKDFDKVRAKEGLGPMKLPSDFPTLTVPAQLLAISDIERVDRGLVPVVGLSKVIDRRAQHGADADQDPSFPDPFVGDYESGNWAGAGNSALLDDFYWMYDDGLGSFNEDCSRSNQAGCWGHRDDVLGARHGPVLMGAAVAYKTRAGTSMAEQFIGGDTSDHANVKPVWKSIAATMPAGLSASRVTVTTKSAKPGTATVKVRAYSTETIRSALVSGSSLWSVSPATCHLAADKTCTLHLRFHAAKPGTHRAVVRVSAPGGDRSLTLVGHRK
jgi:hypothetical protein